MRRHETVLRRRSAENRRRRRATRRLPHPRRLYERREWTLRRQRTRRLALHVRRLLQRRRLSGNRRRARRWPRRRVRLRKWFSIRQQQLSLCRRLSRRRRLRHGRLLLPDARDVRQLCSVHRLLLPHRRRRMHRRRRLHGTRSFVLRVVGAEGTLGMLEQLLRRVRARFTLFVGFSVAGALVFLEACGGTVATDSAQGGRGGTSGRAASGGSSAVGNAGRGASGYAGSIFAGRVPAIHRAAATPCDTTRPVGRALPPEAPVITGECHSDAECASGMNGRCIKTVDLFFCSYDACISDGDCTGMDGGAAAHSGICACESAFRADNNICIFEGNCRTDADCGGEYCSPTWPFGSCTLDGTISGYYCHTAADECTDDQDCTSSGSAGCAYSTLKGHWACGLITCLG